MSASSSVEDRRAAFDAVNRLLADGRLTLDEVMAELDEEGDAFYRFGQNVQASVGIYRLCWRSASKPT